MTIYELFYTFFNSIVNYYHLMLNGLKYIYCILRLILFSFDYDLKFH